MPDFTKPFIMDYDAFGSGVGAVLMQEGQPMAFFNKAMSSKMLATSAYERELMALVLVVNHWHPYLMERVFVVRTDQRNLHHLLEKPITTHAQQQWLLKLLAIALPLFISLDL